jgi:signal transduction histidine kinase
MEIAAKETNTDGIIFDELSRLNNELVGMQRELTKKNLELEELDKLKNQFIGMAAHDLRNPLGNIINFTQFLKDEGTSFSQDQVELLEHIKSQSSFLLDLVNDLLDVTSIESGSINLSLEPVDIALLASQVIHLNKTLAEKKEMKIKLDSQIQSTLLTADKGKIEQVITNLLSNAIKYSEKGTSITVKLIKKNNEIIISVNDQGQGIPEDELNLLFKPFQKTSAKSTSGEKSTGLGLFIVKRIVEAHKGKIWAESKAGVGSTFYVSLPAG